jgi:prophage antirepressor-like protein
MNELQIFNNPRFGEIRWVTLDNKPYAVGKDVASALGYKNTNDAINRHCKGVVKHEGFKINGIEVSLISEGDIYRLISKSELPEAEKFESWVFDEVLPSIRETGQYNGLSPELKSILILDKKTQAIEKKVDDLESSMPLFNTDCKELQQIVRKVATQALGGYKSIAYNDKSLRSRVYSDIQKQLRREFGVERYEAIKRCQFEKAKEIVTNYRLPLVLKDAVDLFNEQISMLGA